MGCPNCSRSLAYSTAMSRQAAAPPTCSAARTTSAASRPACTAAAPVPPVSGVPGAPSRLTRAWGRVGSRVSSGCRWTPPALALTRNRSQPVGWAATTRCAADAPSRTKLAWPCSRLVGSGLNGSRSGRQQPSGSVPANAASPSPAAGPLGQHVRAGVRAAGQDLAGEHRGGEERDREQGAAEFLVHEGQFGQAAAGPAEVLGDAQAGQAHLGAEQPPGVLVVAGPGGGGSLGGGPVVAGPGGGGSVGGGPAGGPVGGGPVGEAAAGGGDAARAFDEVADRLAQRGEFARAFGVLLRAGGQASHLRPLTRRSSRASSSARVKPSMRISSWCSCIQTVW